MKKKLLFLMALLVSSTMAWADTWDGITRTQPAEYKEPSGWTVGSGTEYINIYSAAELAYIRDHWTDKTNFYIANVNKEYYKWNYHLKADLDMGDWSWTPLGSLAYAGTFDGEGHTIRINISGATDNYQGVFSSISPNGNVYSLHVTGNIHCSASRLVGGIAGENYGKIVNCWVGADVRSDWTESWSAYNAKVGGITGENNGTVEYCCMTGKVTNNDADVGGIVGDNSGGTVSHCTFYGSVSSTHSQYNVHVGSHGTEGNCYVIFHQSEYNAASASARTLYRDAIQNPYFININNVGNGTYEAKVDGVTVTRALYEQTVTLTKTSGTAYGITIKDIDGNNIAYSGEDVNQTVTITMPRRDVNVTVIFYTTDWDDNNLGTEANPYIIDKDDEWVNFANKVNAGKDFSGKYVKLTTNINVTTMVGCMANSARQSFKGHFDGGGNTINCQISADENHVAPFRYANGATFKDLTLTGSVTITGEEHSGLGGIVAYAEGTTTFTNCKVSTALTASAGVTAGGFVGDAVNVSFQNCTFDGKLLGGNASFCGGFVGFAGTATLNNCLFKPSELTITANNRSTFVYQQEDNATFSNCYYTQALGTVQGKKVYASEPSHGLYAPTTLFDGNTYYLVIGTEGESGGVKTYQITEDTDAPSRIIVKGTVELNLGQGTTLHARKGIELSADNSANLTINGPGALTIDECNDRKSGIGAKNVGTLVINGGTINTHGGSGGAGIGGDYSNTGGGSITINGGVVNATGHNEAAGIGGGHGESGNLQQSTCGNIVINGGQVTAIGDNAIYGIGPGLISNYHSGTLTLGLTNPDDFVYIGNNYNYQNILNRGLESITIVEGKTLYDEDGVAHSNGNVGDIYFKTLRTYDYRLTLSNDANNSAAIASANGKVYNVTLSGRTLFKDGNWNTLCLPFAVTVGSDVMKDATAMTLNGETSGFDASTGVLTLNFTEVTSGNTIAAGTPFIVKWTGTDVSNPVFSNVTIVNAQNTTTSTDKVDFVGSFSPVGLAANDKTVLYLGLGKNDQDQDVSTLYYPSAAMTIGAFRAYFQLKGITAGEPAGARYFVLNFGEDGSADGSSASGIAVVSPATDADGDVRAPRWYSLDGVRLDGKPATRGIYIRNGRKVVIK